MFSNGHITYISGHFISEKGKHTPFNPLLLFFSYLAAHLDNTEKYPGTEY